MNSASYELTAPAELQQRREDLARTEALTNSTMSRLQQLARAMGVRMPGAAT